MPKQRNTNQRPAPFTYTLVSELMASATDPMPVNLRRHQATRMYQGLRAIEAGSAPNVDDWRVVSDAVNLRKRWLKLVRHATKAAF